MGEFDLIARYFQRPARRASLGIGDDCAIMRVPSDMELAISTDLLVEGRHFLNTVNPEHLGHKSLAVNLSDLAACGAMPWGFTLSLALPRVDERWLEGFSQGLFALADEHQIELVGGDTTQGPLTIGITIWGLVPPGQALVRHGAQPGDDIYVSGTLGDARLALEVFRGHASLDAEDWAAMRLRMDKPTPRIALGLALRGVASAAIDLSDGLVGDLGHVLKRSHVGATLNTDWIDTAQGLSAPVAALPWSQSLEWVLSGGDDYELLFTAHADHRAEVQEAAMSVGVPVTHIGRIERELGLRVMDRNGEPLSRRFQSFDHFA
jgi:thiamine-monophosphate kinase